MALLFVENLTAIDCSVLDPDRGLVGASWSVSVELGGKLDQQSMVFDFSKVKKSIKRIIDSEVDHKLLVPLKFDGLSITGVEQPHIRFTDRNGGLVIHQSPASALCPLNVEKIDVYAVTEFLQQIIQPALPANVSQLNISLQSEQASGHYYCYSHGLKKHDGNCQRIAHGHRSLIQVWKNGHRDDEIEQWIAQHWQDIYIGSSDDVLEQNQDRISFRYQADQGNFQLELPRNRVHLMNADSTVECIAQHLLELAQKKQPSARLKIKAFEGMSKGAIAVSN